MERKKRFAAAAISIIVLAGAGLTSCSDYDDIRYCPYDKFFYEALDGDAYTLYRRCYASLRSTDSNVLHQPDDQAGCNIRGTDGTTSDFVRGLFTMNELPTDECICTWEDSGVYKYVTDNPHQVSPSTSGFFLRVVLGIRLADTYLSRHGNTNDRQAAEIRLLRALYHSYILDNFGDCGENIGLPKGVPAFNFICDETKKAMVDLPEPRRVSENDPDYGKMNRGVARALLMRMSLNAGVYDHGKTHYQEALEYAEKLIKSDVYELSTTPSVIMLSTDSLFTWTAYQKLFMADNGRNGAQVEAILPLLFDEDSVTTYHATSFLTGSTFDGGMYVISDRDTLGQTNGTNLQWGGNRCRPELIRRFTNEPVDNADTRTFQNTVGDDRALFFSKGRYLMVEDYTDFNQGYATTKFNALYAEGTGPRLTGLFSGSDFFLIRLAEAYMTAAECMWRAGDFDGAAAYINALRTRAHAKLITPAQVCEDLILDEWSREFYFEGRRRTDLIRFGRFYGPTARRWTWKGGTRKGRDLPIEYNNYDMPDTASVGARYLALYKQNKFQEPFHNYFLAGSGIVSHSWNIQGGENMGRGLIPMAASDSDIVLIEYIKPDARFKLIGTIGLWDEQIGSGDYGSFTHNEPASDPINVPAEGLYRIRIERSTAFVSIMRYFSDAPDRKRVMLLLPGGGAMQMNRCNPIDNERGHSWMVDLGVDAHGHTTPFKIVMDGVKVDKPDYVDGMEIKYNEDGFITLPLAPVNGRVRLIFNDIQRSCYFYPIELQH